MAHQQLVSRTEELGYVTPQEDQNSKKHRTNYQV